MVKNPPANEGDTGSISGSGRSLGSRKWQPAPVVLPGQSHGLAGYSPWVQLEIEHTHTHTHTHTPLTVGMKKALKKKNIC